MNMSLMDRMYKNRVVVLSGSIDADTSTSICTQLLGLDHEDSGKDIFLIINSGGGSVTAALNIYDVMMSIKSPVKTIVMFACSAAAILSLSGRHRSMYPNSTIMLHQPSIHIGSVTYQEHLIVRSRMEHAVETIKKIIIKHTKITTKNVEKFVGQDYYLTPEEAVNFGVVDEVLGAN